MVCWEMEFCDEILPATSGRGDLNIDVGITLHVLGYNKIAA